MEYGAMSTDQQDSPAAGWYPDPGGQGLRYWDGTQWTDRTEQAGATQPGAVTKSHRLSGRNRWILVASLIVAVAIADLALRNIEMKRLMDAAFQSEAVMFAYLEDVDGHFDRFPNVPEPTEEQWTTLFDGIHEAATVGYYELAYRYARVDAVFVAPWHRNATEAQLRYLEHNLAWSTELDAVAGDPARLLGPVSNDIGSSWPIAKVALRNAVPSLDLLGIGADVERFIDEGELDGDSA